MHILVIQTAFIGDAILATSILEKINHEFPQAKLDFMLRKGNESLFLNHPYLNKILVWNKKQKYSSLFENLKIVRNAKYDKVICLQRFGSMGFFTAFSGANEKIGFDKNPFSFLFDVKVKHEFAEGIHEVERNSKLLVFSKNKEMFPPKLYPNAIDCEKVVDFKTEKYICIAPSSVWFTKQFPEQKWIEFLKILPKNLKVYLLGGKEDADLCERILQAAKSEKIENLAGKLSLLASAALMKDAEMNYVNDSAPMHLCSSMDAPVRAIYCSTLESFGFGPLSKDSKVIETKENLECRPCGLHGKKSCPEGHFKCAFGIDVNEF